jgi:hypothetical protein
MQGVVGGGGGHVGVARSSGSGQILEVFLTQPLMFANLCSHSDSVVALAAAQCLAQLVGGGS